MSLDSSNSAPLVAADHANDGKYHLLLASSGSVATIKVENIIRSLARITNLSIRIIFTSSAAEFLQGQSKEQLSLTDIANLPNVDGIYQDSDEWKIPWIRGAPILHIELRRWADVLVIAPLSANTLAKIANGICDNLLTSVVRAWEVQYETLKSPIASLNGEDPNSDRQKYIIVAPAMNTMMWKHPITAQHLRCVSEAAWSKDGTTTEAAPRNWFKVLRPEEMTLACGDVGVGGMRGWQEIVAAIQERIDTQGIMPRQ